jgi:hypothetical protein
LRNGNLERGGDMNEVRARAKQGASMLSDPSTRPHSFYCLLQKKVKRVGEGRGIQLSLRKITISTWVEEYLLEVYSKNLPLKEEKKLTSAIFLIDFIMEKKLPEYVDLLLKKKSQIEISGDFKKKIFKEVHGYKVPKKGARY